MTVVLDADVFDLLPGAVAAEHVGAPPRLSQHFGILGQFLPRAGQVELVRELDEAQSVVQRVVVLSFVLFFLPCFFLGMISPVAVKLAVGVKVSVGGVPVTVKVAVGVSVDSITADGVGEIVGVAVSRPS